MIKVLIIYFQFFTRIPIPIAVDHPLERYRQGVYLLPLFGALLFSLLAFIYALLAYVLPIHVVWLMVVVFETVITGGFHQDALADTCDGIFSARKKEDMLRIMKDSRLGTFGGIALIFYYLLYYVLGSEVLNGLPGLGSQMGVIISLGLISRAMLALGHWQLVYSGYNPNGMGKMMVGTPKWGILLGQLLTLVILFFIIGAKSLLAYGLTTVVVLLYRHHIYHLLGGMSGDTVGCMGPLSEVTFLLGLLALGGLWWSFI